MTIESCLSRNIYLGTVHLRLVHFRPVHLRPRSSETFSTERCSSDTTLILDHIHLRPHLFENCLFETTFKCSCFDFWLSV